MAAVFWFGLGAAFCWLAASARSSAADFEERLEALEEELEAQAEAVH
jgi:hypothetical protein